MAKITDCDDYAQAIQVQQCIKAQKLAHGAPEINGIRPIMYTGGFCVVFPYDVPGKKYAVRCWHAFLEGAQERSKKIAEYLSTKKLPYFVDFQFIEEGIITSKGIMPIVVMDWVDAKPLKLYLQDHLNNANALDALASKFLCMVKDLHKSTIAHGDLQHGNILVKDNGDIVLVDYDSMYVPSLSGYSDEISGLYGYQHPARFSTKKMSPKADYFSELVIYTSIKALVKYPHLWTELQIADTDTLVFSKEDIESGGQTPIFDKISKDPYLKELVISLRKELSYNSIEQLHPLEEIEPNEKGNAKKVPLIATIKEVLDVLAENPETLKEKDWFKHINESAISLDELQIHYQNILRLQQLEFKHKNMTAIIDEMRSEFQDNGYTSTTKPIDSKATVDELRKEWN